MSNSLCNILYQHVIALSISIKKLCGAKAVFRILTNLSKKKKKRNWYNQIKQLQKKLVTTLITETNFFRKDLSSTKRKNETPSSNFKYSYYSEY